jgi:hypothetical protein
MYRTIQLIFLVLMFLFAGLTIAFFIYVLITNTSEFFRNILNPLILVYFFPSCICYWIALWTEGKCKN